MWKAEVAVGLAMVIYVAAQTLAARAARDTV